MSPIFVGLVDLVENEGLQSITDDLGTDIARTSPSPRIWPNRSRCMRAELMEAVAELDDDLMEKYLDGGELTDRRDQGRYPQGHHRQQVRSRPVRYFLPQQGRAAPAGRHR